MLATKPDRRWEHAGGGRWRLTISDDKAEQEAYRNQMQQLVAWGSAYAAIGSVYAGIGSVYAPCPYCGRSSEFNNQGYFNALLPNLYLGF
jgi:hypothetical protein